MTYTSKANGQQYLEPKYVPENLNFCATAILISTAGEREEVMKSVIFPIDMVEKRWTWPTRKTHHCEVLSEAGSEHRNQFITWGKAR